MARALLLTILVVTIASVYLFVAHPWWFPAGASAHAAGMDRQFSIALWLLGGLFVVGHLVLAGVLLSSRGGLAQYLPGSWRLEVTWTIVITVLFFGFNVAGERLWSSMKFQQPERGAVQVEVTGVQFQWYFRYPGADGKFGRIDPPKFANAAEGNPLGLDPDDPDGKDDIVSNALVLPAGRDVELILRAQDVIHSLFIPAMRFKQDAVPGMDIHTHFKPDTVGSYEIACAELCGLGHYRMRAFARVVSEEEFSRWLKAHAAK